MKTFKKLCLSLLATLILGLGSVSGNACGETVANFSDLNLTAPNIGVQTQLNNNGDVTGRYWSGPDPNGTAQPDGWGGTETVSQFTSAGVVFSNIYDYCWSGWAYSNVNDKATDGAGNQYAAYSATGGGINGAGRTYAVGYDSPAAGLGGTPPTITLPAPTTVLSASVTNTTYTYLSMLNGQDYPGRKFTTSDSFVLTISGFDAYGKPADGTNPVMSQNLATGTNFLTDWTTVNLASLGDNVKSLQFDLTSTDNSSWGMNTPAYFALGDLTVASVPEPSALVFIVTGGLTVLAWLWRRQIESKANSLIAVLRLAAGLPAAR